MKQYENFRNVGEVRKKTSVEILQIKTELNLLVENRKQHV